MGSPIQLFAVSQSTTHVSLRSVSNDATLFCVLPGPRFDDTFDKTFYSGALGVVWEGSAHVLSPTSSTAALVAEWAALSAVDVTRVCAELGT